MTDITVESYLSNRQANLTRVIESATARTAKNAFKGGYDAQAYRVTLSQTALNLLDGGGLPAPASMQNLNLYTG